MIDITLHILLTALFTVGIRRVQRHPRYDVLAVGAVNYITAAVIAGTIWLVVHASNPTTGAEAAIGPALLTGLGLGVSYFIAFFLLLGTLELRGAAITSALSRLAILVPITLAVALWGERPSGLQWVGIAITVAAVAFMNAPQRGSEIPASLKGALVIGLFFLFAGGALTSQEIFNRAANPIQKPLFLTAGFSVAAAGSFVLLVARRTVPIPRELGAGAVIGAANGLQVLFLLRALDQLPAFLVFAITSAGGLIATAVIAVAVLGERPTALRAAGIGMAAAALVLLQAG